MRPWLLALLAVPLSGCVLPTPTEPTDTGNGGPDDGGNIGPNPGFCEQGPGTFVQAQHHPGFTPPDYQLMFYTLERNGLLTYFRANDSQGAGTGTLRPLPGALHNITLPQVKAEMQAHGVWESDRDYQVSVAWRDDTADRKFNAFCQVVTDEFYGYDARYENNMIADCDAFTFRIDTQRGTHTSYSYCNEGPQGVREAFDEMVEDARDKFGVEGI